jgi:hypothetical protein
MRVTEVDIAFVNPKNGLIAFASVHIKRNTRVTREAVVAPARAAPASWLTPPCHQPNLDRAPAR